MRSSAPTTNTPTGRLLRELEIAGVPGSGTPQQRRARLEALADSGAVPTDLADRGLLHLRDLEVAGESLPEALRGVRRTALLETDRVSTTWWGQAPDGSLMLLRCLRPAARHDPIWHRRLERGARLAAGIPGLPTARWIPHGPWPHVRALVPGLPVSSLLPTEDPPDTATLGRWLGQALAALHAIHMAGQRHGRLDTHHLCLGPNGMSVIWTDPIPAPSVDPCADLAALSSCFLDIDPDEWSPVTQLVRPWVNRPPATTAGAITLLRRCMVEHLVSERHRLVRRRRRGREASKSSGLLLLARRLSVALPPPVGRCCLRAGHDGVLYFVESDGLEVKGGSAAGAPPRLMAPIFRHGVIQDPQLARLMLRQWAARGDGDQERRAMIQEAWGGGDVFGGRLTRWLGAASQLRRSLLLLERGVVGGGAHRATP